MFYNEELNRIILNYEGAYQVASFDYWPTFLRAEKFMGSGFHIAEPEYDIRKTVWANYTVKVIHEPPVKKTASPK